MLREEMGALSSELREVREARHVLAAVRTEAAQVRGGGRAGMRCAALRCAALHCMQQGASCSAC